MKKETKRGRGRPRKHPKPEPAVESKGSQPEPVKGVISEAELLGKVEQVKKVVDTLPPDMQTHIDAGNTLEMELMGLGDQPAETEAAPEAETKKTEPAPVQPPAGQPTDVICELENNLLLVPVEFGLGLEKGFLKITEDEQRLQAAFRPDDIKIKKSAEWYWGINITLLFSKFLKWLFWNLRNKREAKKKAAALAALQRKSDKEEKTRSDDNK